MPTPNMSEHARERCSEMGISTKVAKRIVQNADLRYTQLDRPGCYVAAWSGEPMYAVAVDGDPADPDCSSHVVITVVFRETREYVREGRSYQVV